MILEEVHLSEGLQVAEYLELYLLKALSLAEDGLDLGLRVLIPEFNLGWDLFLGYGLHIHPQRGKKICEGLSNTVGILHRGDYLVADIEGELTLEAVDGKVVASGAEIAKQEGETHNVVKDRVVEARGQHRSLLQNGQTVPDLAVGL